MRAISNEALAASSHSGQTVDDYDSTVSSLSSAWDEDRSDFGDQAAVSENADTEAEDAGAESAEDVDESALDGLLGSEEDELGA